MRHGIIAAVLSLVFTQVAAQSDGSSLLICYEDQYMPPFFYGESEHLLIDAGVLPDLVTLAAQRANIDVQFVRYPWKRCKNEVMNGRADGLFAFIYTDERDQHYAYPKRGGVVDDRFLFLSEYPIFVRNDSSLRWDGVSFQPATARVQSVPGYVAEAMLIDLGMDPIIDLQPIEAMPLIAAGRLDGYVVNRLSGERIIAELGLQDQIRILQIPLLEEHWYVAMSKQRYAQNPDLINALWNALRDVRINDSDRLLTDYQSR